MKELQNDYGCLLSVEDFKNYTVNVKNATISKYGDLRVHGVPPPASGTVLALMLNILSGTCIFFVRIKFNFFFLTCIQHGLCAHMYLFIQATVISHWRTMVCLITG